MEYESKWKRCGRGEANEVPVGNDECRGDLRDEIEHRIGAAARVFGAVRTEVLEEEN